ncbi:MAG: response regulator, partial [Verrucomicrobiota bacterium]
MEDLPEDVFLVTRELRRSYDLEYEQVDSAEKLKAALQKSWDIVICDYSMPGFTGLEALKIVREQNPFVPFIIVSGDIGEEIAVNAMKSGANDYVMKGNLPRLLPAIERELREADSNRARRHAETA